MVAALMAIVMAIEMAVMRAMFIAAGTAAVCACSGAEKAQDRPTTPASSAAATAANGGPADLVLQNGAVHTMVPAAPSAQAVAIRDGRFIAVGAQAEIAAFIGPKTRVIDAKGGAIVPGLVDAHAHLYGLGHALENLQLRGLTSPEEVAKWVSMAADERSPGEWILGRGWDQNLWPKKEFPSREVLDRVAPAHPVALRRVDGHAVWVNGAALKAAGITAQTRDPDGGLIVRDASGAPTGVLVDAAMQLVEGKIPPDSADTIERKIRQAQRAALMRGLAGVHEMGISDEVAAVYRKMAASGELAIRVYGLLSSHALADVEDRQPIIDADGTAMFTLRGIKLYADGALGSRGAALLTPYSDDPENSGLLQLSAAELESAAERAAAAGWQLAIHAIGDRGNRLVLDAFETAYASQPGADLRMRVEHAQVIDKGDIDRFAALGVIASMQPTHATSDMPWAGDRVGSDRLSGAYAWRTLKDSGAVLAFGSDFPVEEVSPLLGLYAATTRQDADGKPAAGWLPAQRLSLEEALHGFTVGAAYAAFAEQHRGKIAVGYVADVSVFDRDLVAGRGLLQTKARHTIVGGEVEYMAGEVPAE